MYYTININWAEVSVQGFGQWDPQETALGDKGAEQSWQISKDAFHGVQEVLMPRCKKSGKEGKRLAWMSQDLLVKLKSKRELTDSGSRDK